MKFYITGTRRGLGKALSEKYDVVDNLNEADVFINCKHDGFTQVQMLYEAAKLNKKIINIGSAGSDWTKGHKPAYKYGIEKKALRDAPAAKAITDADTIDKLKAAWDEDVLGTSPYK